MAPIETPTAPGTDVEKVIKDLEGENGIGDADTVGDYVRELKNRADRLRGKVNEAAPDAWEEEREAAERVRALSDEKREEVTRALDERLARIEAATKGNEDLHIDHSLKGSGEQGNAQIGGGRSTINVNPDAVEGTMAGQAGVNKFKNLAGHENAHATEQAPIGDIQTAKGTITNRNLYEWDAEKKGAAAEGKDSKSYHRDGQPADYKEAQDQGNDLEKVGVSSDELSNFLAKGDTEGLQKRVIEGEIKNGTLTPEQLEKNITVGQEKYTKAVADVLTADPKEVPAAMAA